MVTLQDSLHVVSEVDFLVTLEDSLHDHVVSGGGGFSVLLHESVPRISQLTVAVICICIQFWKCFALRYHGIVSWYLQCSLFFYLLGFI